MSAARDGDLVPEPAHLDMRAWPPGEAEKYTPLLLACYDRGGALTGAFDGVTLAGVAARDTDWRGPGHDLLQRDGLHLRLPVTG